MVGSRYHGARESARTARRVALVGTVLAAAALLSALAVYVQGRRTRTRLEGEIIQLKSQLSHDRHTRVPRLAALAAERKVLAERDASLGARVEALHEAERALRGELAEARAKAAEGGTEVEELKARLRETQQRLRAFELDRLRTEQMIGRFQAGVAFVEGAFGFFDAAGLPLRYIAADANGVPETDPEGKTLFTATGSGPIVRLRYMGTAFLVGRDGHLFTNRHIAEPWWRSAPASQLAAKGFTPRLEHLRAYFPAEKEPFDLRVVGLSEEADAALVAADLRGRKLPVFPIDAGKASPAAGQPIVLLGYPTGLDAVLARIDEKVLKTVLDAAGGDNEKMSAELARLGLLRPLSTQGHLSDVLPGRLTYDAQTTLGGSGGPVLSAQGKVIGVNAAILTDFSGASFGVPVRFAVALLPSGMSPRPAKR